MIFINPKTDFAFKKIFGSKESKPILISFLNAVLYQEQPVIKDLEIVNPYQSPKIEGFKNTFLDVKAQLANDTTVIIEMQVLNLEGFEKRILYNAAKAFSIQLNVGDNYTLLNPVIALTITDFKMFSENTKAISNYSLKEKETLTNYSDDIELVFVELPKFKKKLVELETLTEKWLYFLKHARRLDAVPASMQTVPALKRAFQIANQSALTPAELEALEQREMFIHDNRNAIARAAREAEEKGKEMGIQEGKEMGIQEGIELGIQEGIELGIQEGIELGMKAKTIELARALLDSLDVETIRQKTGLSLEEIHNLKQADESCCPPKI